MPTEQPTPERQTADLLAERDLLLFPVRPVNKVDSPPRSRSRQLIGYVTRNSEVIRLAMVLGEAGDAGRDHPMVVAARWIQAGYSADSAARWITGGVSWPKMAQTMLRTSGPMPAENRPHAGRRARPQSCAEPVGQLRPARHVGRAG